METPDVEVTNTINPNMKICKHCNKEVAKSAKQCPHCGGKLKRGSGCLIGCLVPVILVIALILVSLTMCGIKTGEIDQTYTYSNSGEFCVSSIEICTPVELIGTGLVHTLEDVENAIVVKFTYENTGKYDVTIEADDIEANYDNGIIYSGECLYTLDDANSYTPYAPQENGVLLEKVTSDMETFFVVVPVPSEVVENTDKPLEIHMYNRKYTVR